ncbi:uncharacterized protein LOC142357367 [Convolutriloba macropyga]|uniref:uncharacterized protein LOC142357367 n=1 Tax=Convolutriloba macropyga TaxID=536237 RepID=UPI003F520232
MFYDAAKLFWMLTIVSFYLPVLVCHVVACVVPLIMDMHEFEASIAVILANVLAAMLTGVQAKLLWEKQSIQNDEAFQLYRTLEAETSYRLMLINQGIHIRHIVNFTWQCKDFELRLFTTLPAIPHHIYKRWCFAVEKKSINK